MKRKIHKLIASCLSALCLTSSLYSQEVLWQEDFNLPNGTTSGTATGTRATNWEANRSAGKFDVQNGELTVNYDGGEAIFSTMSPIDISGGPIDVSVDLRSVGSLESSYDYVQVRFIVDGNWDGLFTEIKGNQTPTTITANNVTGNQMDILIFTKVSAGSEFYHLDNISVTSSDGGSNYEAIPWVEDFNFPSGTTTDQGLTSWEAHRDGGKFDCREGELTINRSGPEGWYLTGEMDISGGPVDISFDIRSTGDLETSQDYVEVYMVGQGVPYQQIANIRGNQSATTLTIWDVTGSTLELLIRAKVSAGNEYYHIDNLSVLPSGYPPVWKEDFDLPDGTDIDNGPTAWEAERTTGQFDVRNGKLCLNKNGSEGEFTTEPIDISGGPVALNIDIESLGNLESSQDYIQFYKRITTGTDVSDWKLIEEIWGNQPATTITDPYIAGDTLELKILGKVSAGNEYYYLDNLCVIDLNNPDAWEVLFDGQTLNGWGNKDGSPSTNWVVQNGEIALAQLDANQELYLVGRSFENFVLEFDWKLPAGHTPEGNSGVKYRVKDILVNGKVKTLGIEYNILDDENHHHGPGWPNPYPGDLTYHYSGSIYDLEPAREDKPMNPLEQWNSATIVCNGKKLEHYMNGELVAEIQQIDDPNDEWDWFEQLERSKFPSGVGYGEGSGRIFLQDHNTPVWYKNIRIHSLD